MAGNTFSDWQGRATTPQGMLHSKQNVSYLANSHSGHHLHWVNLQCMIVQVCVYNCLRYRIVSTYISLKGITHMCLLFSG